LPSGCTNLRPTESPSTSQIQIAGSCRRGKMEYICEQKYMRIVQARQYPIPRHERAVLVGAGLACDGEHLVATAFNYLYKTKLYSTILNGCVVPVSTPRVWTRAAQWSMPSPNSPLCLHSKSLHMYKLNAYYMHKCRVWLGKTYRLSIVSKSAARSTPLDCVFSKCGQTRPGRNPRASTRTYSHDVRPSSCRRKLRSASALGL
jgi:hypothetical protein